MSAGNAFASASRCVNGHGNNYNESRPSKGQRVSEMLPGSTWLPSAASETSLEVDIMILDYLACRATTACLQSRKAKGNGSNTAPRSSLQLVDSFMPIFKARHPQYQPDAELRLRLLLLKMATLFTQRFTLNPTTPDRPSLQALRNANRQRAEVWMDGARERRLSANCETSGLLDTSTLPSDKLERNRAHVLHQLGVPAEDEDYEDAFYGTAACVSLLDLLPLFVELSAASSSIHGSNLNPRWMHLACEFMLQASLEKYLVCGATGLNVLDEAFAWGYAEEPQDARTDRQLAEINDMFEDELYATELDGWQELKIRYVQELADVEGSRQSSADGPDIFSLLESVAAKHPMDAFEALVLKFLEALFISIAQPVLVQLERGQLDGMSREETKEFLMQCGVESLLS